MEILPIDSDPDRVAVLLRSGVCLTDAEAFLKPEQLDDVDIERYLSPAASC
ncbi:hypothetical protein KBZ19_05865 [Synechococcus sp. L2F]|uniref:hypothetical protein n=1 Tax=Synechococcus sp. L2F TaxID=2823739 RepID=UPI0020CC0855|nr:hypothetical protein [Synechococcus sp. L2F]MCP9828011.1 hypothetical protein [Synechococcus sp. L2F]